MKITYNITERKPFVKALEEITQSKSVYQKSPTFAYKVDCFTITREGNIEFEDNADLAMIDKVVKALQEQGYNAEDWNYEPEENKQEEVVEVAEISATYPRETFTETAIENLKKITAAKAELIKKALGAKELKVVVTEDEVNLPWIRLAYPTPEEVQHCIRFIDAICHLARTQKRVNAKEKEIDNEKYAFRCFLLRLGFIGDEHKALRKFLLRNFKGSAAFKNGGKKDENR